MAPAHPPRSRTTLTPTVDPSRSGFTTRGKPNAGGAGAASASPSNTVSGAQGTPTEATILLASTLLIETAEAATPDPVYGTRASSKAPWMQPSSPRRPWSAMKATSISAFRIAESQSPRMSISTTGYPFRRSAEAAAPPVRSDTSRSEDSPPRNTPTVFPRNRPFSFIGDPPHFPLGAKRDPRQLPPPPPPARDEPQDVGRAGPPPVDHEIGVLLRKHRVSLAGALHPRPLQKDRRPLQAGGIPEGGAERPLPPGLAGAAPLVERLHAGKRVVGMPRTEPEPRTGDDPPHGVLGRPVGKTDVPRRDPVQRPLGIHDFHPLDDIPDGTAVRPGVHRQRSAHRTRDPTQFLGPGEGGQGAQDREPREHHTRVGNRRPPRGEENLSHVLLEADHRAANAAVRHEQVAAPPQRPHFPVRGALRREDLLDLPHRAGEDQPFGRPTDSDGGELPHLGAEHLLDPFSEICRPIAVGAEPPPPLPRPSLRKRSPCVRGPVSHRRAARPRPPGSALLPRGTPRKRRAGPRHGTRRRTPGTGHVSGSTGAAGSRRRSGGLATLPGQQRVLPGSPQGDARNRPRPSRLPVLP